MFILYVIWYGHPSPSRLVHSVRQPSGQKQHPQTASASDLSRMVQGHHHVWQSCSHCTERQVLQMSSCPIQFDHDMLEEQTEQDRNLLDYDLNIDIHISMWTIGLCVVMQIHQITCISLSSWSWLVSQCQCKFWKLFINSALTVKSAMTLPGTAMITQILHF